MPVFSNVSSFGAILISVRDINVVVLRPFSESLEQFFDQIPVTILLWIGLVLVIYELNAHRRERWTCALTAYAAWQIIVIDSGLISTHHDNPCINRMIAAKSKLCPPLSGIMGIRLVCGVEFGILACAKFGVPVM